MTSNGEYEYPIRGHVYAVDLSKEQGSRPYLIISNNTRNRALPSLLAVRVTTSPQQPLPSVVELSEDDPMTGRALCDDIVTLFRKDLQQDLGGLSLQTMMRINEGLRHALSL
ncbi:type II toxin-antitoxin system PemK/MazF family toxin [Streptosporangiaceae bacterium NEAU-GS5]|nr:type II toxin-antitoxin system PemK/MazF family toxin [Streptosporangiaceae bacterium NEAU-GS5]